MRPAALLCLLLAACGADKTLVVTIPTRPDGTLDMTGARPKSPWNYKLLVTSTVEKDVKLVAGFDGPAPEEMVVRIAPPADVPREGTANLTLVIVPPEKEGPFEGTVAITSPDLPGFKVSFPVSGTVVPKVYEGPWLRARPAGVDLGKMRPGEEKPFAVALVSYGDQPVTIKEWAADDPQRVRVAPAEPVVVAQGGELQFTGTVIAPTAAGPFDTRVLVHSDARNQLRALEIRCAGIVVPDYAPNPPTNVERAAFPVGQPEFAVEIVAREEAAPFTVVAAEGHERHFEVLSLGAPEPAPRQRIKLRLRRDAPTDPLNDAECRVRFRVQPGGVEVSWPVKIRLYPPVYAHPSTLHFGTVSRDKEETREIILSALPGRAFQVKSARSEERTVAVSVPERASGMAWRVVVSLPQGLPAGIVSDRIAIETDDPDVPLLLVPVKADVR
jgi:hypothetical protein